VSFNLVKIKLELGYVIGLRVRGRGRLKIINNNNNNDKNIYRITEIRAGNAINLTSYNS
jgi:hypothetical protein